MEKVKEGTDFLQRLKKIDRFMLIVESEDNRTASNIFLLRCENTARRESGQHADKKLATSLTSVEEPTLWESQVLLEPCRVQWSTRRWLHPALLATHKINK